MDENDIYEALGVPHEEPEGDKSLEAGEETPAEEVLAGEDLSAEPPEQPPGGGETWQEEVRRQAETIDMAYADAYAGQVNPYTGQPIKSKADYDALQRQKEQTHQQQVQERLRALGLEPGDIEALVSGHPVIQQAEQLVAEAQARQEEHQRAQAKEWYAGELREIAALDPGVTDLETLKAQDPEQFAAMLGMVSRGVGLAQAYKMLNFDALMQRQGAASAQQERNRAAGKAHLIPTKGLGAGAEVEVPDDVRQMYRAMNPGMSDAEIRKEYAAYLKENK